MNANDTKSINPREGLKWSKVIRFIVLPFSPSRLKVYMALKRFEHLSVEALINDGVKGVLLDADGTLGTHHTKVFPQASVDTVQKIVASGIKVAIFTNSTEDRFSQFENIPVVSDAMAKPDPLGFKQAMENYLHLSDPENVCMVGDSFITDGGAVDANMRFIHVLPVKGRENWFHKATRYIAYSCARFYYGGVFDN
jgi:HAD superfamily phosphatase (TIGR01668 family)